MKTILTFILLVLTSAIHAQTAPTDTQPDFQVLLSGIPDGEGRYIVEEGFSSDAGNQGNISSSWLSGFKCVTNGTMLSINLPPPRIFNKNDSFINSKMTINYYICPYINLDQEHAPAVDYANCEKISSHHVALDFIVKKNKIGAVYTPNKLNVDVSAVAHHYPACTPKPIEPEAHNSSAYRHILQP